ncbi:glycosyltransferase family 4 protein [Streptomyces tricolor]|uniref:glycosyltransferase family 4 protein n=2 Tax=Streptomyces tricolor TaxID=68277 RepID=UPI0036E28848
MHQSAPAHRPRVLHLAQPVDGGVARVVLDLARAQLAAGLRVTAACPGGPLAAGLRELGADVREWRAGRAPGPGLPGEVRRLARLIEEVRPELVHAHSAKAGLAARLAVRGRVPTVYQPHAWSFEAVGGLTAALALRWERWGARWADRVLCVSEAERTTGLRAGVRAAYTVVPNGIDTTRFTPAPPTGTAPPTHPPAPPTATATPSHRPAHPTATATPSHRPAHPTATATPSPAPRAADGERPPPEPLAPGDGSRPAGPRAHDTCAEGGSGSQNGSGSESAGRRPLVVCVGRLCRQKGQDVLLAAWEDILGELPHAELVLVGDGPDHASLRHRAHPSVRFAGAVPDAVSWYRAADLVVLPSRWEGMALAPLEALACGTPVVLTDVDGARESLPPALAAHCLVPPEDPAALAGAVTALLTDPPLRAALADQGRRHVLATHDVRHTADRIAALYRELLGPTSPCAANGEPARPVPSECRESIHS